MKWSSLGPADPSNMLVSLLLAASIPAAASLQCDNIVADGHRFNFDKLKGPHSVVTSEFTPPTYKNTTYTIDLCGPLKRKGDVPKGEECPNGTWSTFPVPVRTGRVLGAGSIPTPRT